MTEKKITKELEKEILKDFDEAVVAPKEKISYKCYYCKTTVITNDNLCQSCQVKLKKPFKETI